MEPLLKKNLIWCNQNILSSL